MTKTEYLSIGYIRSNCFSKVKYLIDHLPKSRLHISRSYQDARKDNTGYRWLNLVTRAYRDLKIQWDAFRDPQSFRDVLNKITELENQYKFEDFVVDQVQVVIDDKTLDGLIRKYVNIPENVLFLVTFRSNPVAYQELDGWSADIVSQINHQTIKTLNFKKGVLDLVSIELFQDGKKLGVDLTKLLNEKEIVARVLKNLDRKVWDELPEIRKIIEDSKMKNLDPGGIRTYEKISGVKWKFVSDEGVH